MELSDLILRFASALLIGVLVGLEREYARIKDDAHSFAGIRTFPLIALLGCSAALMGELVDVWAFVIVTLLLGSLIAISYAIDAFQGRVGMTSEVAAVVVYVCGALAYWDQMALAAALAVVTFGFLTLKPQLHRLAGRVSSEDLYATLKFAIISLIILPVLPDRTFGPPPFDAFNPYKTWLMVVLISGISFLGYVLIKAVGTRRGNALTGILGGLVSSTAVTLSFSQRSKEEPDLSRAFSLAIILAWTVMFGRIVVEVAILNRALLQAVWLPMVAAMATGLLFSLAYFFTRRTDKETDVEVSNPFELRPAVKFGVLYALILIIAKAAQYYFSDAGLYVASLVAGLADVDAITLSMAELAGTSDGVAVPTAAKAVVLAAVANTVVKGAIALGAGSKALRPALLPPFLSMLAVAVVSAFVFI